MDLKPFEDRGSQELAPREQPTAQTGLPDQGRRRDDVVRMLAAASDVVDRSQSGDSDQFLKKSRQRGGE